MSGFLTLCIGFDSKFFYTAVIVTLSVMSASFLFKQIFFIFSRYQVFNFHIEDCQGCCSLFIIMESLFGHPFLFKTYQLCLGFITVPPLWPPKSLYNDLYGCSRKAESLDYF